MPRLKDKIENALNETRILILGGQVLIGSGFRSAFNAGFDKLPTSLQQIRMASLTAMVAGLGFLLIPAAYHRIVEDGSHSDRFHLLVTRVVMIGLVPFAV